MDLILPVAGQSTRFSNVRPKWMLTHPDGNFMVTHAIRGLPLQKFNRIILVALKEHLEKYKCREGIHSAFAELELSDKFQIVELDRPTRNQPETVASCLEAVADVGSFYVKDCDNFFIADVNLENSLAVCDLNDLQNVTAANKSYIKKNASGIVTNVIEKRVVSSEFCCGGYSFRSAEEYLAAYQQLKNNEDLYLSHVIFQMILSGIPFVTQNAKSYEDWGTISEWNEYKSTYGTIFLDIDGVLVENAGRYFSPSWGETGSLKRNINAINRLQDTGRVHVVLTTSRPKSFSKITEKQLAEIGVKYDQIVYGLPHAKRILVNDFAATNPYPTACAINIERNSVNQLEQQLLYYFGKK